MMENMLISALVEAETSARKRGLLS